MHGLRLAEVAPAAPALAELIPPLLILTGLIFALGCIVLLRAFVTGVFSVVQSVASHVPGLGSLIGNALTSAEQAVSNALGSAIVGIDARIATQFHNLANAVVSLWHHLETSAVNLYDLAKLAAGAATFPDVHKVERDLRKLIRGTEAATAHALREIHRLEGTVTQTIPRKLASRLHAVEHAISVTIPKEIKSARDLAKEAEDGVARLWDRVRNIEQGVTAAGVAAIVAAALAAVGLDWLGCKDGASRAGKSGCALWDDVGTLLGLLGDVVLFANVCAFLEFASPFVSAVADVVVPALTDVGAGLCSGTIGPPPPLPPVALHTPAAVDATLYTP